MGSETQEPKINRREKEHKWFPDTVDTIAINGRLIINKSLLHERSN